VLTYPHLTRVYGTEVYVDVNDLTGALVVTPLSARARERLRREPPPPIEQGAQPPMEQGARPPIQRGAQREPRP